VQEATFQFSLIISVCFAVVSDTISVVAKVGAEVLTRVKARLSADGAKVVALCSDNDCKIPDSVESKVKIHKSQVQVVNVDWLFGSIGWIGPLQLARTEPKAKQAKELWAITWMQIR
jgi:hypothetical protein